MSNSRFNFTVVFDSAKLKDVKIAFKAKDLEDAVDWVENGGYLMPLGEYKILDENDEVVYVK